MELAARTRWAILPGPTLGRHLVASGGKLGVQPKPLPVRMHKSNSDEFVARQKKQRHRPVRELLCRSRASATIDLPSAMRYAIAVTYFDAIFWSIDSNETFRS
jgi:hypothetical protein